MYPKGRKLNVEGTGSCFSYQIGVRKEGQEREERENLMK
jgi:hypothetical protein